MGRDNSTYIFVISEVSAISVMVSALGLMHFPAGQCTMTDRGTSRH